jgi:Uma2 family endonuclease
MAARPEHLLTAEQFLEIDFPPDVKAELDNGVIRMMGGTRAHARVQMNLYAFLRVALRGSGCRPFGSDMAVRTHNGSVRYPDVSIERSGEPGGDDDRLLDEPRVVFEILSPSTRRADRGPKLDEYRAIESIDTIVLIDPATEWLRVLRRIGPGAWQDREHREPFGLDLPAPGVTVPHLEIFARD